MGRKRDLRNGWKLEKMLARMKCGAENRSLNINKYFLICKKNSFRKKIVSAWCIQTTWQLYRLQFGFKTRHFQNLTIKPIKNNQKWWLTKIIVQNRSKPIINCQFLQILTVFIRLVNRGGLSFLQWDVIFWCPLGGFVEHIEIIVFYFLSPICRLFFRWKF